MDVLIILVWLVLLIYLVLRMRKDKEKKAKAPAPVHHIRRPSAQEGETSGEVRPRESPQTEPGAPAMVKVDPLVSIEGWKPMNRSEVEVETLWRLEHVLRDIPHMGETLVVQVDYSMEPREVATVLASNPIYAAKILKTVNSAAFGLRQRIDSLQRAITYLGYNQVKNIVLEHIIGEGLNTLESVEDKYLDSIKLWKHSHAVSVCADYILREVVKNTRNSGLITTAALLHDIGWVVFNQYDSESAQRLFQHMQQEAGNIDNPLELEEKEFGFNHLILSKMLAEQWEIPEQICELLGQHHCATFGIEEGFDRNLTLGACVISRAEILAGELGYPNPLPEPKKQNVNLAKVLGRQAVDGLAQSAHRLRQELEKTMKFIAVFHKPEE